MPEQPDEEQQHDTLLAALEEGGEPDQEPRPVQDVRSVLEEIGAEEAIAHLEARLAGIEQELERRDTRQRDFERARRGEADLMRARIDDALELVRTSMDEQRETWNRFESRFVSLLNETDETAQAHIAELRDELTPRVEGALLRLEETEASLRGELHAASESFEQRAREVGGALEEMRARITSDASELSQRLDREQAARTDETHRVEQLLEDGLGQLRTAIDTVSEELREQVASLRRELDSAVGELRAGLKLRGAELEDRIEGIEEAVDDRLQGEVDGLEQRWIEGTRDIARRIEQTQREVTAQLATEREARREADDAFGARLDEVTGVVDDLRTAVGQDDTRRRTDDEQLRRELDEISSRLDVLQSKVASAVGQIASQLTNRVATLGAEQQALRDAGVRREERIAAMDGLEARVAELSREVAALRETATRHDGSQALDELSTSVEEARRELSSLAGTVEGATTRLRELGADVDRLVHEAEERAALRHEVRELTARNSELAERLEETERLARAAGKAIASAVRRSRSAQQQRRPQEETLFFRPDGPSATPPEAS